MLLTNKIVSRQELQDSAFGTQFEAMLIDLLLYKFFQLFSFSRQLLHSELPRAEVKKLLTILKDELLCLIYTSY